MGLLTKGMGAILRNRASKKAFKTASSSRLKLPVIKSVKPAKNLTKRRKDFEDIVKGVDKQGKSSKASKMKHDVVKKASGIHDRYEKASSEVKKYNRRLKQKTFGGASAAIVGAVGAHVAAKKKFPKYKKFAESDIKTVDGKLKIVPKKKK